MGNTRTEYIYDSYSLLMYRKKGGNDHTEEKHEEFKAVWDI